MQKLQVKLLDAFDSHAQQRFGGTPSEYVARMGSQTLWCIQSSSCSNAIEQIGFGSLSHAASAWEVTEYEGQAGLETSRKRVPIGADFQAVLPRLILSDRKSGFSLEKLESDSPRWLGERVWPLQECDPAACEKGVFKPQSSLCSCASQNAVECVRLHIKEERDALKIELGEAFYAWGFDEMGETVTDHWTWEEELTFQELVRKNPLSQNKNFWYHLFVAFPSRGTRDLVSYYFNVFVLRRRAIQNRVSPLNIDSDDDEMVLVDSEDDDSASLFESDEEIDESQVDAAASEDVEVDGSLSHVAEDSVDEDNAESSDFAESSHESTFVRESSQIPTKASSGFFGTQHSKRADEEYLTNQISELSHGRNQEDRSQALRNWEIIPWNQQNHCHSYRDEGKSELPYVTYPLSSDRQTLYDCSACKESFLVNSHECVIDHRETKVWEAPSLHSSQKDVDKLISTKGMMEEFFGAESREGRK